MKKILITVILGLSTSVFAQVGIGTTNPNAALNVTSTNDGVLVPRVALTSLTDAVTVLTLQDSELVFNTATAGVPPNNVTPGYYYWNVTGNTWVRLLTGQSNDWSLTGNTGTNPGTWAAPGANFIGTSDNNDLFIRSNNTNLIRIKTDGNMEFGGEETTYPLADAKFYFENRNVNNLMGIYTYYNPIYAGSAAYTAFKLLNANSSAASLGEKQGIYNEISPEGLGRKTGVINVISDTAGVNGSNITGVNNFLTINSIDSGAFKRNHTGTSNTVTFGAGGKGIFRGVWNSVTTPAGGTHAEVVYGVYNQFAINTNSNTYGAYTTFSGTGAGNKYGYFVTVPVASSGTHYGIYSDVTNSNGYAGYFLGNVTVKRDIANNGAFFIDNENSSGFSGMYFSEGAFSATTYRGHIGHVNSASTFAQPGTFQIASGNRDLLFGATNGANTFTERMRINNDTGYVGINTNPTNVGSGDPTPANSTLHVNGSISLGLLRFTGNDGSTYVVSNSVCKLIVDTGNTGSCTITLPAPATCAGRMISISRGDANTRVVNVQGAAGQIQSLGGSLGASTTIPTGATNISFWSDGVNWYR